MSHEEEFESYTPSIIKYVNQMTEAEAKQVLIEIFRTINNDDFGRTRDEVHREVQSIYSREMVSKPLLAQENRPE